MRTLFVRCIGFPALFSVKRIVTVIVEYCTESKLTPLDNVR